MRLSAQVTVTVMAAAMIAAAAAILARTMQRQIMPAIIQPEHASAGLSSLMAGLTSDTDDDNSSYDFSEQMSVDTTDALSDGADLGSIGGDGEDEGSKNHYRGSDELPMLNQPHGHK